MIITWMVHLLHKTVSIFKVKLSFCNFIMKLKILILYLWLLNTFNLSY